MRRQLNVGYSGWIFCGLKVPLLARL